MSYESFRNILTMNLCKVIRAEELNEVLKAVDISAADFDVQRKPVSIITTESIPEVVKVYIAAKAISNLSKKTLNQYRYKLFNFFNAVHKPYMDIQANDIRMYLYHYKIERNASDRYMENIRITLNGFFQWLFENEYIKRNPCLNVEHIKFQEAERTPFTSYELEEVRWNCQTIREKALIDFLFSTGCRVSECSDVNLNDIDWKNRCVIIRHGKGNKQRTVFFNAESELSLRKYLEQRKGNSEALFCQCKQPYDRLSPRAIELEIQKIGKRLSMEVFPHRLRHTFATISINSGMPLEDIQALMGHATPRTTLIYAKNDFSKLKQAHQRVYA